jgi:hypothetical protein
MSAAEKATAGDLLHPEELEKASQALKALAEAEKAQIEARKLSVEERKLQYEVDHAPQRDRADNLKSLLTLLTPILTTLMLGATLVLQSYQFSQTENSKKEAAEDAQWAAAVKTLSDAKKLSPAAAILNPFLKSKGRHTASAKQMTFELLIKSEDTQEFTDLFQSAFEPVSWENLPQILELDRTLSSKIAPLATKSWDMKTSSNDLQKLNPTEQEQWNRTLQQFSQLGTAIAPLLKARRPEHAQLDLRSTDFRNCDWKSADLSNANLDAAQLVRVNLDGADLSGVTHFDNAYFEGTPWWEANRISPELLKFLKTSFPYSADYWNGKDARQVTPKEYEASVDRLGKAYASVRSSSAAD